MPHIDYERKLVALQLVLPCYLFSLPYHHLLSLHHHLFSLSLQFHLSLFRLTNPNCLGLDGLFKMQV